MTIHREVLENGDIVERPYNTQEMAELAAAQKQAVAKAEAEAKAEAAKAAAQAKLAALGLTTDDLKALGL